MLVAAVAGIVLLEVTNGKVPWSISNINPCAPSKSNFFLKKNLLLINSLTSIENGNIFFLNETNNLKVSLKEIFFSDKFFKKIL